MAWGEKDGKIEIIFKIKMIMNTTGIEKNVLHKRKKGNDEGGREEGG